MGLASLARTLVIRQAAAGAPTGGAPADQPRHVLVIRPDHLGDLLLTTPALAHLRAAWPDARITLLVGPWNTDTAAHLPMVDEVLTLDFPYFDRRPAGPLHPYTLLAGEARRLRAFGFDTAVVMRHDFWWGALLAARAGIPRRAGFDHPDAAPLLTDALPTPWPEHEAARCLALAGAVTGAPSLTPPPMAFRMTADERAWTDAWLADNDIRHRFVVMHPGSGAAVKLWPAERWATVAGRLNAEAGVQVVVTGAPNESALVEGVKSGDSGCRAVTLVGAPIGRVAAVLARAAAVLGPDSGVLHLAQAVGTPTVRLFGPASTARFGPWGDAPDHQVVHAALPCWPCERLDFSPAELPLHPCVRAIDEQQVLAAARSVLATAGVA